MFTRWGDLVYRFRFAVIVVVGAAMLALGAYGMGLGPRLTQSGWFDPGSESVQGAQIADGSYGRDHNADVIVMYNAPEGKTIDDPEFQQKVVASLTKVVAENPEHIGKINGTYWKVGDAPSVPSAFGSKNKKHAFASIAIAGDNDTVMMANYRAVQDVFTIPGVDVEVSGLQPIAVTLTDTLDHDSKRMEVLAFPAVAILLFFIFGGIVAAALPLIIGGLTIMGATGIVMALTNFTEVNIFVTGVVSMIGLGLAIDYGLFIVSRFREELAEGYSTPAAVRRSVMTAGRTVVFSATMIIASLGGILIFPQGFLRSVAYGTIAAVSLAALTAITILPAMLGILGHRVDALGLKRFRKTKTAEQIENGFWGNTTRWVMKHPLKIAIPITVGLLLLIIPVKDLAFGGINEKYLPPDNATRSALEHFYEVFPQKKTDPIQLVFVSDNTNAIGKVWKEANQAPGLVGPFEVPVKSPTNPEVFRTSATLIDPTGGAEPTIDYLRSIEIPDGVTMYVTGQPALMADSIDTLLELMPWMILLVLVTTTVLMFLTFGSLVLPIKAALMSALGLGATLGILTWIFVDGNGAGVLNFTPQPISAPVLMLIIAIIYGLSTDYEVFLLSRMVEARAQGASTTEAVRIGTAQTGRIITAAALILLVVTGAFAFSDMVMMQYIAYGMIAALFIDATILRMLLVPAIMKLLGDDCWWAPKWMKRIQEKIGLGEPILDDERPEHGGVVDLVKTTPITDPPTMQLTAVPDSKLARTPRRPRTVAEIEAEAPTQRIDKITETDAAEPTRSRQPMSPDPTRPRASMLSSGEPTRELPVVKPGTPAKAAPQDPAKQEDSGPDLPKYVSGEPTQVLPIVKPDTPNPVQGPEDSTPDTTEDEDRGYSGPSFGTPPIPLADLGDPRTGPGGAARSTNGRGHTNGTTETPTGPSISRPGPVDTGSGLDLPGVVTGVPPRGSERVQPPSGYTPGVIGETPPVPRVSTPDETGDGTGFGTPPADSPPRPSIVPPARPNTVTPPPRGIVPPQAPRIVNTPPNTTPPAPPTETPPSGTFNGFSPVTASNLRPVTPDSPAPESSPPAEPSRPAEPSHSAESSRPAESSHPAQPSLPFEQSRPAEQSHQAEQSRPAEQSPPFESGHPAQPSHPFEQSRPAEQSPPFESGHPAQPSHPFEQSRPAEQSPPFESGRPAESSLPFEQRRPFDSSRPTQSSHPAQPSHPFEQSRPAEQSPPFESSHLPEQADAPVRDTDSRSHEVESASSDFTAVPGAHRAESYQGSPARAETEPESPIPPQSVFGTAVPVEPQPSAPWNNGMTGPGTPRGFTSSDQDSGPRFSPVTPSSADEATRDRPVVESSGNRPHSARPADVVRPQVAPPGFTEVRPETAPSSRQPDSATGETAAASGEPADEAPATDQIGAAGQWRAPSGFTAVPTPAATPAEPSDDASPDAPDAETDSPAVESPADTRNEIENWMAQLRSSRRGTAEDEGRHHGNEGRTVSVNELLRRREDD
ncbi:RND superfamily putative drug exporter [Nocardia fluminea]|uniref:RND superfamily putative drug exporter n=1 Tax=Nocardia fluminea TaxID=134984 RepID=A0A2N3VB48_9NOCA|nr:RND superfamily putative drug exporter [Nocardia fluminea]